MTKENETQGYSLLRKIKSWALARTLGILPITTSCCLLDWSQILKVKKGLGFFGGLELQYDPALADLLIVSGPLNPLFAASIKENYENMLYPKWVMAVGDCACSGGLYQDQNAYNSVGKLEEIIPVDVLVPGCPPVMEEIWKGLEEVQRRILMDGEGKGHDHGI